LLRRSYQYFAREMTSDLLIVPPTLLAAGDTGVAVAASAAGTTAKTLAAMEAAPSTPRVRI
jgi:hypothetical protein